jgi:hypothetical protein
VSIPDWVLQAIKLPPKLVIPIFLLTGFLLFAPMQWRVALGLGSQTEPYRLWMGLGFVFSACVLLTHLTFWVASKIEDALRIRKMKQRLGRLTHDEKKFLQYFLVKDTRTRRINIDSGVAGGLSAAGIVGRSSSVGNALYGFPCNITDAAFEYLKKHPDLVGTPGDDSLPTAFN